MRQMTDFGRASMRKSFKNKREGYQDTPPDSNEYQTNHSNQESAYDERMHDF